MVVYSWVLENEISHSQLFLASVNGAHNALHLMNAVYLWQGHSVLCRCVCATYVY